MKLITKLALTAVLFSATASAFADVTEWDTSCTLDNGKYVSVGGDFRNGAIYTLSKDSNMNPVEIRLAEDSETTKVTYFSNNTAQGAINYVRFHKGNLDYVVLSRDTAQNDFNGVEVYKKGKKIFSHQCAPGAQRLSLNFSEQESQLDDVDVADKFD